MPISKSTILSKMCHILQHILRVDLEKSLVSDILETARIETKENLKMFSNTNIDKLMTNREVLKHIYKRKLKI